MSEFKLEPLHTNKGSKIWYSKYGVGKQMGSKLYVCRNEAERIVPEKVWCDAIDILWTEEKKTPEDFNCICYDFSHPNSVRFDECPFFYTEREPVVGKMIKIDTKLNKITKLFSPQFFHHKWLWINPNKCTAFDVQESYEWSKLWLSKLNEPASGYIDKWHKQLKSVGLE